LYENNENKTLNENKTFIEHVNLDYTYSIRCPRLRFTQSNKSPTKDCELSSYLDISLKANVSQYLSISNLFSVYLSVI